PGTVGVGEHERSVRDGWDVDPRRRHRAMQG
ncbi:MAG: hypothetical protein QOK16_758, partial [Solirubrobacteraceae bacterium]|nr:hypothetical protein [Solirubrobacteraceae bacterium]MEA2185747.1 hypothetical protein [Solirubrobacteraceae bacterium]